MLLWLLFALFTAAVLAVILRPLMTRASVSSMPAQAADVAVYKDQLMEIDADLQRGVIGEAEAVVARREISRRLLARMDQSQPLAARTLPVRNIAAGLGMALPVAAMGAYLWLGAPGVPARPFASVAAGPIAKAPVDDLIAKVEARLAENPGDGRGWDVIAPVYFRLERFADAANAYQQAGALLGPSTARLAGFAEATVMVNNGIVTEPARLAYETIAKAEPDRVEPKFWLALAQEQDGKTVDAAIAYRALLASAPTDANWRALIEERLAAVTAKPTAVASQPRGPTAADVKSADTMSDRDRGQMIAGMVDGLARRLEANPQDVDGWLRLVRAYAVLGEQAKAGKALSDARRTLAGDVTALGSLTALAKELGLGS